MGGDRWMIRETAQPVNTQDKLKPDLRTVHVNRGGLVSWLLSVGVLLLD